MSVNVWTVDGRIATNSYGEGCEVEGSNFVLHANGFSERIPVGVVAAVLRAAGYEVISPKALDEDNDRGCNPDRCAGCPTCEPEPEDDT